MHFMMKFKLAWRGENFLQLTMSRAIEIEHSSSSGNGDGFLGVSVSSERWLKSINFHC